MKRYSETHMSINTMIKNKVNVWIAPNLETQTKQIIKQQKKKKKKKKRRKKKKKKKKRNQDNDGPDNRHWYSGINLLEQVEEGVIILSDDYITIMQVYNDKLASNNLSSLLLA